jgi:hypothetical protein
MGLVTAKPNLMSLTTTECRGVKHKQLTMQKSNSRIRTYAYLKTICCLFIKKRAKKDLMCKP